MLIIAFKAGSQAKLNIDYDLLPVIIFSGLLIIDERKAPLPLFAFPP